MQLHMVNVTYSLPPCTSRSQCLSQMQWFIPCDLPLCGHAPLCPPVLLFLPPLSLTVLVILYHHTCGFLWTLIRPPWREQGVWFEINLDDHTGGEDGCTPIKPFDTKQWPTIYSHQYNPIFIPMRNQWHGRVDYFVHIHCTVYVDASQQLEWCVYDHSIGTLVLAFSGGGISLFQSWHTSWQKNTLTRRSKCTFLDMLNTQKTRSSNSNQQIAFYISQEGHESWSFLQGCMFFACAIVQGPAYQFMLQRSVFFYDFQTPGIHCG